MFEKSGKDLSDKDNFLVCRESLLQEEEIIEHVKTSHDLKGSKNEVCIASAYDISSDDVLDFTDRREGHRCREIQVQHETTTRRLEKLERKVNEIVTKMNDDEQNMKKDREGNKGFRKSFCQIGKDRQRKQNIKRGQHGPDIGKF